MITQLIAQGKKIGDLKGIGNFLPGSAGGETGSTTAMQVDNIFSTLITFLTIVAGLAFLIYFIIGALNWVTAGGDAKKVDTAKSYMTNGAIGMIIIVASYSIVWIVGSVLGLQILEPGEVIKNLFE
jgi:hypothetical protein